MADKAGRKVFQVSIKNGVEKIKIPFTYFRRNACHEKRRDLLSLIHGIKYAYISWTKKPVFRKQHGIVRNSEFKLSYLTSSSFKLCKQKQIGASSKTDEL